MRLLGVCLVVGVAHAGCPPGLGCEAEHTYARAEGVAFRNLEIGKQFPVTMETWGRPSQSAAKNPDFVVADPSSIEIMEFCLGYPASTTLSTGEIRFRVDASLGLGAVQRGSAGSEPVRCFSSFARGTDGLDQYIVGLWEFEGRMIRPDSFEATFLKFDPPTLDLKLSATDDLGEAWTFELVVESGVGGNSDFCD